MSLKTNPTLQAETDGHVFAEADDRTLPRQRFGMMHLRENARKILII